MDKKIVLTDYPKLEHLEMNYRGVETEELLRLYKELYNLMMCSMTETAGGYAISYNPEGIEKELEWRKVLIPPQYGYKGKK